MLVNTWNKISKTVNKHNMLTRRSIKRKTKTLNIFLENLLSSFIRNNAWKLVREFYKKMYTYYLNEMMFINSCKKAVKRFVLYFLIFSLAVLVTIIPHLLCASVRSHRQSRFATDLKYILFYNQSHSTQKSIRHHHQVDKDLFATGQTLFIKQKCTHINCYITYNRSLLPNDGDFDAVVFDLKTLKHVKLYDTELNRMSHQKYVFRSLESSEHNTLCHDYYENFFNWTWTYKLNSDIPHPFINIYDKKYNIVGPKRNITWKTDMGHSKRSYKDKTKTKKKAVAWIVDKCKLKSKHKDFLADFQKELKGYKFSLDTYGACGKKQCPGGAGSSCYKMIEKDYYFQLVLEDYFSEDYVTDKIVRVMAHATIPIVSGGINYDNFLPPGSYINAQTLDIKRLGAIINYLINNATLYEYFFDWKSHYYYTPRQSNFVCDLCEKLNDERSVSEQKSYQNLREWWDPEYKDTCERTRLYSYFNKH